MPKIGHIVLSEGTLKSVEENKTVLLEPFCNIDVPQFPHTVSFTASIGLFNLEPNIVYNFAYSIYSPTGEKIEGNFFDIQTKANSNDTSIFLSININISDITFEMEGVHQLRFQIGNLHEEKSTFFYVKQKSKGDTND